HRGRGRGGERRRPRRRGHRWQGCGAGRSCVDRSEAEAGRAAMTPREKKRPTGSANGNGVGEMLGDRYRLDERIAGGGMGEVWRATDTLLERIVAVKLLRESLADDPIVSERFRREALLAASISHPNMAGVFDYVQEHDRPGIAMGFG